MEILINENTKLKEENDKQRNEIKSLNDDLTVKIFFLFFFYEGTH